MPVEVFFQSWWQGLVFGVVTSVAMLAIGYALSGMWKKYDDEEKAPVHCEHHH